tara:strand:- start:273 stop:401 length:129 start_codon:yes stop_codon:yes gene_type:complete
MLAFIPSPASMTRPRPPCATLPPRGLALDVRVRVRVRVRVLG